MRSWLVLAFAALSACNSEPAFVRYQQELALLHRIEGSFSRSVDAEKSAVLADSDEESKKFAAESRAAAGEVDGELRDLSALIHVDGRPADLAKLAAVESSWAELRGIDARLLELAVANTNLKAMALSAGDAARALDRVVAALTAIADGSADPEQVRKLAAASIAALRIQTLHAPHIASANAAEMDRLEGEMSNSAHVVSRVLTELGEQASAPVRAHFEEAAAAWAEYQRTSAEVVRLSRENTNVRSFDLSIHEKRTATERFRAALAALVDGVQSSLPATR